MDSDMQTGANLLRLIGLMGIAVGIAWAVQVVLLGSDAEGARMLWVVAAAAICGAGVGAVAVSRQVASRDYVSVNA